MTSSQNAALRTLGNAVHMRQLAHRNLIDAVAVALDVGASWAHVGAALGVSPESARERFAAHVGETANAPAT